MKTTIKFFFSFAVLFLTINSLIAQKFESFVIIQPEKPLYNISKAAILNFSNYDNNPYYNTYGGSAFANYLTSELLDENRGIYNLTQGLLGSKEGKSYIKSSKINSIQIVEREQLYKVIDEKNISNDIAIDDNKAAEIGKVLGIDALIMGTIKHIYNSNKGIVKLSDGTTASSTENSCTTEVMIKVVSVANGQIIATNSFKKENSDKKYGKQEGNVLKFEQLAESNMKIIAYRAANYISPYYLYYKADFRKIKTNDFKEKNEDIKRYIENADFKNLYSIYKAIFDADNYNADVAYNIALIKVITGDYKNAAEWDRIAYEADPKEFGKAKEWADSWEQTANTLEKLGVIIEKVNFDSQINTNALADKIKTKGKREDRFEVFENPSTTSSVVAKIPGDSEFIIIEKSGDFTKIKLLGGKEGYISNENIKK